LKVARADSLSDFRSLFERCRADVRTLVIAFTIAVLPWDAEAGNQSVFENERVIAWRLGSGERAAPLAIDAFRESSLR
jgi:hypothetical protein